MNHRDFAYDWRATMGNAEKLSSDVAAYLDLIQSLVQDDGGYPYRTANWHTCAIDNPMVMLHHVQREELCSTPTDHRLFDKALAEVKAHRRTFMDDAEMHRRMQQADGACPMCGHEPSFHTGDYGDGYQPMMSHCQHTIGSRVRAEDIDAFLRRPQTWRGACWPYSGWDNQKLTRSDGTPHKAETVSHYNRCTGCQEMEAYSRMEQALFALVNSEGLERFAQPGWSSPVSEYVCKWGDSICTDRSGKCDHVYMQVKRAVGKSRDSFSGSTELRLNGAGLKLLIQPVRPPVRHGEDVKFGMKVSPTDQCKDYPGFQAFAHELFNQFGVPTE